MSASTALRRLILVSTVCLDRSTPPMRLPPTAPALHRGYYS